MPVPSQTQIDVAIRELVADGCTETDTDEVWDALVRRFGARNLDFRLRVTRRELDERAVREERRR